MEKRGLVAVAVVVMVMAAHAAARAGDDAVVVVVVEVAAKVVGQEVLLFEPVAEAVESVGRLKPTEAV